MNELISSNETDIDDINELCLNKAFYLNGYVNFGNRHLEFFRETVSSS